MSTYPNSRKGNTPGAPVNPATKGRAGENLASFDRGRIQTVPRTAPELPTNPQTYITRQQSRGPMRTAG